VDHQAAAIAHIRQVAEELERLDECLALRAAALDVEAEHRAGIGQGTIRLSIGLEDPADLIDDLKRALKAAEKAGA
jgi:cystathionine beta-lyase/cystathionine gamma-synthase